MEHSEQTLENFKIVFTFFWTSTLKTQRSEFFRHDVVDFVNGFIGIRVVSSFEKPVCVLSCSLMGTAHGLLG